MATVKQGRSGRLWLACALAAVAIAPAQAQTATEIVLHNFPGPAKAATPYTGVIRDSAGNLYGTTVDGGTGNKGTVYRVDTAGHRTVLYSFTGGADGSDRRQLLESVGLWWPPVGCGTDFRAAVGTSAAATPRILRGTARTDPV
jgi:uncharacterized repeat protein (TIGR03803 family)